MSIVALTNFLTIFNASGQLQYRFQNGKVGESIAYSFPGSTGSPARYSYLSFIYQGAAKNRTGDNLEAALLLALNELSQSYVIEAVRNRWNVRVDTCLMNPDTFAVQKTLTTEHWLAASVGYDTDSIEVLLSSAIDAVGANAPTRVLTKKMVGSLPSTGQIQNR